MKRFYLTTPLYYPNAPPHVGSAYTTIVCDVLARYKRMCGEDVAFFTGTDEHGEKLERAAAAAGVSPREFVAEKRKLFLELWKKLGIDYTHFAYTDQADHVTSVQRLLRRAQENEPGVIYKGQYQGRYCVNDERYISDGAEPANCDICGRPAELISEENYFFKLSAFQERLLAHYAQHPEFVRPDFRRNEVTSFVKSGLRDISVSRKRIKWGIPWPDDPEQVFYVWYDALTGYLTGLGYAQGENGSADFQKYWRNDASGEVVHMIGKDILRFHAIYWPAFLMAARMPLPKTVFAHGWIYYEQDKMSKSKGNVVYPEPIVDALNSFGAPGNDALCYYLLREAPFGQDMSFSYEGLIQRFNSDLANDLGNLANRTLTMLNRYFGGEVPSPAEQTLAEREVAELAEATLTDFRVRFDACDFSRALESVWQFIARVNKYLVETQPWALAEADMEGNRPRLAAILSTAAEAVRFSAILLAPVIPQSAERLCHQLRGEGRLEDQRLDALAWGGLKPGRRLALPEIIFPRLDKAATLARLHELAEADLERDRPKEAITAVPAESGKTPEAAAPSAGESRAPSPEKISIEDFAKVDMRVGEIVSAEPVAGAKKLTKLRVDIGTEVRQVVAGIAEYYSPEQLVGMKVVLVTNLQPRKLRGVESNGMIVAATVGEEGRPVLVTFKEDVPNGARLK
ncbi:MAG: methionine--tRNA ligase [Acidobacteriia bacterium]|nr:methionine--tRNA ligase [Terriglobia bacterium]